MRRGKAIGTASNMQVLGDTYMKAEGKVFFHGEEVKGLSGYDVRGMKSAGGGYATNEVGVVLYKGERIDATLQGSIDHLDGDWARINSTGVPKYLYRGQLLSKREAQRRGCNVDTEGRDQGHVSLDPSLLLPEEQRAGKYHRDTAGQLYYK